MQCSISWSSLSSLLPNLCAASALHFDSFTFRPSSVAKPCPESLFVAVGSIQSLSSRSLSLTLLLSLSLALSVILCRCGAAAAP
uniref:Putative secreted protein n=1 Tax=Anopheles marajoara TaxID=58244 RepID=A0A2M4CB09_9DIPT